MQLRLDITRERAHADAILVGQASIADKAREATRAVAALLDLAAIGIDDAVAEINARLRRGSDDQDLISPDAEAPVGQKAELGGVEIQRPAGLVEHDKVVARALHLGETKLHAADYEFSP